jgi:hypothetical protein
MRFSLIFVALFYACSLMAVETIADSEIQSYESTLQDIQNEYDPALEVINSGMGGMNNQEPVLTQQAPLIISVVGQGVAPLSTQSPAQAYALAKRAAIADGYRLIAEKVKGVRVDGQDVVKNMMVKRSTIRTAVHAMVKNANVIETVFKDGLCEVEMEIAIAYSDFAQ